LLCIVQPIQTCAFTKRSLGGQGTSSWLLRSAQYFRIRSTLLRGRQKMEKHEEALYALRVANSKERKTK